MEGDFIQEQLLAVDFITGILNELSPEQIELFESCIKRSEED